MKQQHQLCAASLLFFALIFLTEPPFLKADDSLVQTSPAERVIQSIGLYPHGRLQIGLSGLGTKYFGEYTDNLFGYGGALSTRYILPSVPEFGLGVRVSHGNLRYLRRYRQRFGDDFDRQFPPADFPDYRDGGTIRSTKITTFEGHFYLHLFPRQRLNYYLYAGYGILSFQPDDIVEDPLNGIGKRVHYPDYKDQSEFEFHMLGGVGIDYFVTRDFAIGVHGGFHLLDTDILDGYALLDEGRPTENDGFAEFGIQFSYFLFGDNDVDGDGLSNERERQLGTNPYKADTDEDGVKDFDEVEVLKSNPFVADTDGDGLHDYDESHLFNTNIASADSDNDGIEDYDEVKVYHSNPRLADTDNDGLTDREEIDRGSDPLIADSDGDGVLDSDDRCPRLPGFPAHAGCVPEPTIPEPEIRYIQDTLYVTREIRTIEKGQSYTPYGINFQSGKWDISIESEIILDDVARWLRENPDIIVEIRGHTDAQGSEESNHDLSRKRAEAVRSYLISQKIASERLTARGFGESQPVIPNTTEKGLARNRRIEFFVKEKN